MAVVRETSLIAFGVVALLSTALPAAAGVPPWLPRYALDVHLDVDQEIAVVHQRVTWTNRHARPASELVFNAHSHFKLPERDVGMTAKTLEILRLMPSDALDFEGRCCQVRQVTYRGMGKGILDDPVIVPPSSSPQEGPPELPPPRTYPPESPRELPFHYQEKNDTALEITLPHPVGRGETVTVDVEFTMRLPQKMGRWGQWKGVTFLSNWLPVLAVYDDTGWQPTPFIPWHQPFFNEAGVFNCRLVMPSGLMLACSAATQSVTDLGGGWQTVETVPFVGRDFAILCSARYQEQVRQVGPVRVRVLAFPEHEFYAKNILDSACQAIEAYSQWFGPYPYPQFTIAESYFGWLGNECAGLVMIDERIFAAPHAAARLVDGLIKHETCHQWWYNLVGTNGYCETWMDEGLATYFSYRLVYTKCSRESSLIEFPKMLEWMPNVRREDYRFYGLYGAIGRGDLTPTVQPLDKFGHLVNLMAMTYDKGSKITGMIEDRIGSAAFLDFMHRVFQRYQYRILRVADFQRELEEYTGRSWDAFFRDWLYGAGLTDWAIQSVKIRARSSGWRAQLRCQTKGRLGLWNWGPHEVIPCKLNVVVRQKGQINEPTVLGISFDNGKSYAIRIPIMPQAPALDLEEYSTHVEVLPRNRVRVQMDLPDTPTQITVDPDSVLVDRNPMNNYWKPRVRVRATPLLTMLDENDLTNAYDRWNVNVGPWFYTPTYQNPFFTRDTQVGIRAEAYRTQDFFGGIYSAYRTDYRDFVVGVDGLWDHVIVDQTQVGFIFERRLAGLLTGEQAGNQAVLFGRYVLNYGDSLYLPPFHYVETFCTIQNDLLPFARETVPGAERYTQETTGGLHYHINYETPYWDPEGGFQLDLSYAAGMAVPGVSHGMENSNQVQGQLAWIKSLPAWTGPWLSQTKIAARIYGAFATPNQIEFFSMGGGELFRGFDLAQRQGSSVWVGSLEWRVPLARNLTWDFVDHAIGIRNVNTAWFYDAGDVYLLGHTVGGTAQALGAGLRLDVSYFSLIERSIIRLDAAKCVNDNAPVQFWLALEHPF